MIGGLSAASFAYRRPAEPIEQVHDGKHGMAAQHARPGVAHDHADFFAHRRPVAVNRAFCAGGFLFLEGTAVQPVQRVPGNSIAVCAKSARPGGMLFAAVELDHFLDGVTLADNSGMCCSHEW